MVITDNFQELKHKRTGTHTHTDTAHRHVVWTFDQRKSSGATHQPAPASVVGYGPKPTKPIFGTPMSICGLDDDDDR